MQQEAACKQIVTGERSKLSQALTQLTTGGDAFLEAEALLGAYDKHFAEEIRPELMLHPVHPITVF